MTSAAARLGKVDYPFSDNAGSHETELFIRHLLVELVQRLMRERGRVAHVAGDQLFYWVQGNIKKRRAPDYYVIEGLPQDTPDTGAWLTWHGHVPRFALEIVSKGNWKKGYRDLPVDYEAIGVEELFIFDPGATARSRTRLLWQVYRRREGKLLRETVAKDVQLVHSEALGVWFVPVRQAAGMRIRIAEDAAGTKLIPTDTEFLKRVQEAREDEGLTLEALLAKADALRAEIELLR